MKGEAKRETGEEEEENQSESVKIERETKGRRGEPLGPPVHHDKYYLTKVDPL
jgi:hypothetical protein